MSYTPLTPVSISKGLGTAIQLGQNNVASGPNSTAIGGLSNTASGDTSWSSGLNCNASGNESQAFGTNCIASDYMASAFGYECSAVGPNTHAYGSFAKATSTGEISCSSTSNIDGDFLHGDVQSSHFVIGAYSTNGSTEQLKATSILGSSEILTRDKHAYAIRVVCLANRRDAAGSEYQIHEVFAHCTSGTLTIDQDITTLDTPNGETYTWTISASSNIFRVEFTGTAGQNVNAVAMIDWVEVVGFA